MLIHNVIAVVDKHEQKCENSEVCNKHLDLSYQKLYFILNEGNVQMDTKSFYLICGFFLLSREPVFWENLF